MTFLYLTGLLGVAVFSMSGALAAGYKGFDWVGVVLIALVTALGGGTVRDVLIDRETVFWISDPNYVWVTLLAAGLTLIYTHYLKPPSKTLLVADALGLALFSLVGAQIAVGHNVAPVIVVLMGAITGVVGGVLRDILVNEIPLVCRSTEAIYTFAAVIGIVVYLACRHLLDEQLALALGMLVAAALRMAGIYWNLRLPAFQLELEVDK